MAVKTIAAALLTLCACQAPVREQHGGDAGLQGTSLDSGGSPQMIAHPRGDRPQYQPIKDSSLSSRRVADVSDLVAARMAAGRPTLELRLTLAQELLRDGRPDEAISTLQVAEAALEAGTEQPHAGYQLALWRDLGYAWMKLGEQSNCVLHHGTDSCLLPISDAGQHSDPTGSQNAMAYFERVLRVSPGDLECRWMLNVAAMTVGHWPDGISAEQRIPLSAFSSDDTAPRFRDVAQVVGLAERGLMGGACLDDFDGDGMLDIVISQSSLDEPMAYYHNAGDGQFVNRTTEAGLAGFTGGANLMHADTDNDGDLDILVLRGNRRASAEAPDSISLLLNDSHGVFRDVTENVGLLYDLSAQAAAFADFDGDGRLDLFVGDESLGRRRAPSLLFRALGDGSFEEVGAAMGLNVTAHVTGSVWGDYDDDGDPDLALARLNGPPQLFRNDGARFCNVSEAAGILAPQSSRVCWWSDSDNDGRLDLFVIGYRTSQTEAICRDYLGLRNDGVKPRLYKNVGNGNFADLSHENGLWHVLPALGGNTGDLDGDGWLDFYVGTGEPGVMALYPNRAFLNQEGVTFADVTTEAKLGHLQKGSAVVFGDVDFDGDQDIFTVIGGYYPGDTFHRALFENPGNANGWVTLLLEGVRANRSAIGARVRVRVLRPDGSTRDIHHLVGTGGSMGSQSLQAELGLGDATAIEEVEVRWPGSGVVQVFKRVPMRRFWRLLEGQDAPIPLERKAIKLGGAER
jgi:hypothetical protein